MGVQTQRIRVVARRPDCARRGEQPPSRDVEEPDSCEKKDTCTEHGPSQVYRHAGLGILVAMHLSAKNQGTALSLCNLGQKFHEALQMAKLLTVFEVYNTEAAAVASLSKMHENETYLVAG